MKLNPMTHRFEWQLEEGEGKVATFGVLVVADRVVHFLEPDW